MKNTAEQKYEAVIAGETREYTEELERAICAGMAAGGDELDWDAPEFSAAREASKAATWDFDGWRPVRNALLRGYVILGDTVFA